MADNVTLPGTGTVVASDDISGVQYQFVKLVDGTLDSTNKAVVSAGGALKVDNSANTQPVSGTFWQATQPVSIAATVTTSVASPSSPTNDYQTASIAAGATGTLTTASADGKKLTGVEVWTEVAYRVAIHTVDNAVESANPVAVGGGQAYQTFTFRPPNKEYITLGSNAGLDAFRAKVTNMDSTNTVTVYGTFHLES